MTVKIRSATQDDAETIARFNSAMAEETEGRALDAGLINRGVVALLADERKGRYWVADDTGKVVGQIMVTYEWSDWRNGTIWWIQSVYIDPDYRRQGVFSSLYRHVEQLARSDADCCGIRLYVERDNQRAMQTYEALGMIKPGYEVMEVDFRQESANDGQGD